MNSKNILTKISYSNLHFYFFYAFLFSIPFQTRKVFLTQYSFYSGAFTEYASFFIYASDIFLILVLFFWLVFNKYSPLERGWGVLRMLFLKQNKVQLLLLAFILWLIISAIINHNHLEISAFQIIKFIELFLLVIYIYFNLANKKTLITSLFIISLTGFLQSLIAIYQFIFQQSLFNSPILAKVTGEVAIGPQIPGIAKIAMDGEKMVRAYGTLPHSNVLGGFLIFSVMISIYLLLEHKYAILSRYKLDYIQFYNIKFKKSQAQTTVSLIWIIVIFVQVTALLFTFSRSAWAGFAISMVGLIFLLYIKHFRIVSRETICNKIKKGLGINNSEIVSRETIFTKIIDIKSRIIKKISVIVSRETISNFKRKLNCYLLAIFISFLFIGLFDHYFWTLQQGRLIFWLVLGMLLIDMRFKIKDN